MSNSPLKIGRRHFLTGLGGFALAIPFLPSLERQARAMGPTASKRFFYLGTDHGGCWDTNFFPTVNMTQSATVVPGHTVSAGTLSATVSNGQAVLSPVLTASSATLTPGLLAKMNVLRGLDVPWYIGHNTGQHLGNFARNDNNGADGMAVTALGNRPTIDQIMATSPEFYSSSDLSSTTLKSMVINSGRMLSYQFLDPTQGPAGGVQNNQGLDSSLQLFNAVFGGRSSGPPMRAPVIDKVLANYNSLLQSNARLSQLDRQRLQTHIEMLSQLQTSVGAQIQCTTPATPTMDAGSIPSDVNGGTTLAAGKLWLDIVAAAFACNASRIGVYGFGDTSALSGGSMGTPYAGNDWHHEVAHLWYQDQPQAWLAASYQQVFEQLLLYLASKLDQLQDVNGQTVLDNSLLVWSQESCMETHTSFGLQTVTLGGAAGAMHTGLLCDYRNLSQSSSTITPLNDASPPPVTTNPAFTGYTTNPGLLWEQWLATELQLMGVPPSEFELWNDANGNPQHGYGTPYIDPNIYGSTYYGAHYGSVSSQYFSIASTLLPFLSAM